MTHPPDHLGHADLDSIRGQLDEAAATERAVNMHCTGIGKRDPGT